MSNRNKKPAHDGPHKYFKAVFRESKTEIFRCGLPDCPHFVYEPMIVARLSICWRCSGVFVITKKTLRSKKFHCEECTRLKFNKPKPPAPEISQVQEISEARREIDIDNILADARLEETNVKTDKQ